MMDTREEELMRRSVEWVEGQILRAITQTHELLRMAITADPRTRDLLRLTARSSTLVAVNLMMTHGITVDGEQLERVLGAGDRLLQGMRDQAERTRKRG